MIIDDDSYIVDLFKGILSDRIKGAKLYDARNGLAAMYALGKVRPRLLVVDLMMPELAGWELIAMIRQFPELDATRIIVVSGQSTAADMERMKSNRVDYFLTKPVNADELANKARTLLGIRQ